MKEQEILNHWNIKRLYWSRRIIKKDGIIYEVYKDKVVVLVVTAIGHYGDK